MNTKNNECNYKLKVYKDYINEEADNDFTEITKKINDLNKNLEKAMLPTENDLKLIKDMREIAESLYLKTLERLSRL